MGTVRITNLIPSPALTSKCKCSGTWWCRWVRHQRWSLGCAHCARDGWDEHRSGCRHTCKCVHQHVPTLVSLSAPAPLPGGVPGPMLPEQRSPQTRTALYLLAWQLLPVPSEPRASQPHSVTVRQSSSAWVRPEEQFLLSALRAALRCSTPVVTTGKRFTQPSGSFPVSFPAAGRGFRHPS